MNKSFFFVITLDWQNTECMSLELKNTFMRANMFLSSTSSARWLRILDAGSNWKWSTVSLWWRDMENSPWSKLNAFQNWSHVMLFPLEVRQRVPDSSVELFKMLFRIFLKLCWRRKKEQLVPDSKVGHHTNTFPSFVLNYLLSFISRKTIMNM